MYVKIMYIKLYNGPVEVVIHKLNGTSLERYVDVERPIALLGDKVKNDDNSS
jgi:hypothetical protein